MSLSEPPSVVFENVGFRYSDAGRPALDSVSFNIPAGTTFAIAGKSGAGKTTLVNLLLKLVPPCEGRILINGTDLQKVDRNRWLSVAGAAGQDMELSDGTVRENLTLGLNDVDDFAILKALKIADVIDVICGNPNGLDAKLGSSGMSLSGGQRQRLVLARALLRHPEILVLDESTNAVDSVTESRILANIRAAFPDITLIVIAHRSGVTGHADHYVELASGRVKNTGAVAGRTETGRSNPPAPEIVRSEQTRVAP